ncbi:MAG: serine/threonine-protein kinase [Polyangiaceae bacterium]
MREAKRELVDRMRVEAQALAALDGHPNLLLVSDFGETPAGQPFIVTERLYGRNLLDERRLRGEIPVEEAIDLVCQALAGLGAAHEHGLVHRDIKPGNLFLCEPRRKGEPRVVKVLDFGVVKVAPLGPAARSVAPLAYPTLEGVAIGTPKYFAAEQAMGAPVDPRADLYSMGAVLYGLVAGRGPFDHHRGILELTRAAIEEPPAPPSAYATQRIVPALDGVVLKALAKAPADRFQSAEAFVAALRAIDPTGTPPRWERTEIVPHLPSPAPRDVLRERGEVLLDVDDAAVTNELPDDAAVTTELPDDAAVTRELRPRRGRSDTPSAAAIAPKPTPYAATILLPMQLVVEVRDDALQPTRIDVAHEARPVAETLVMHPRRAVTRHALFWASLATIAFCVLLVLALAGVRGCWA